MTTIRDSLRSSDMQVPDCNCRPRSRGRRSTARPEIETSKKCSARFLGCHSDQRTQSHMSRNNRRARGNDRGKVKNQLHEDIRDYDEPQNMGTLSWKER